MFFTRILCDLLNKETNPLVDEDAENSKVDYAYSNPAFKGIIYFQS